MPERPVQLKSLREYTDLLNYVEAYRAVYVDTDNTPNNTTVRGRALLTLTGEDRAKFLALRGRGSVAFHEFLLAHPDLFNLGGLRDMHSMVVMGRNAINLGGGSMPSQDAIDEARADYMVATEEAMLATNEVLAEKAQVLKDAKSNLGKSRGKRFGKTLGAVVAFALIAGLTGFLGAGLYGVLATSLATTLGIASGASVIGVIAGIVGGSFLIKSCIKRFKAIGKAWNDNTAQVNTDKAAVAEAKREHEKALQKARVNESRYNEDLAYENSGAYGRSVTRRERTMGDGYESVYTPVADLDDLPMPELGEIFDTAYRGRTFASEDEAVAYVRAEFGRHSEDLFDAFTEVSEESKNAKLDEWAHAYVASHPPVIAAEDTHSDDEEEEVAFDINTFAMPAELEAEISAAVVGPFDTKDNAISAVRNVIDRTSIEIKKPDGADLTRPEFMSVSERWSREYVDAHWEALKTPETEDTHSDDEEEEVAFDINTFAMPAELATELAAAVVGPYDTKDNAISAVLDVFENTSIEIRRPDGRDWTPEEIVGLANRWAREYVDAHWETLRTPEEEVAFDINTFAMPADLKSSLDAFVGKYKTPEEARIAISRFIHEFNSTGEEIKKPDGSEFTVGDFRKIVNRWTDSYISENWESLKEEEDEIKFEDTHTEDEEYAETEEFLRRINFKFKEMLSAADETIDSKEKLKAFVDSILSSPEFGFDNLVEHLRREGKAKTEKARRQVYDKLVEVLTEEAWKHRVEKSGKGSKLDAKPAKIESGYESTEQKMNSETRAKIATELGDAKFDNVADATERVKAIVRGIDDETLFSHISGLKEEEKEGLKLRWAYEFVAENKDSLKAIKSLDLDKIDMPGYLPNKIDTSIISRGVKFVDKSGAKLTVEDIIESLNVNLDYIGGPILSDAQKEMIIRRWANAYVESRWEHIKASEVKLENEDHKKAPESDLVNVDKLPLPEALKNLLDSSVKKDLKKFTDRTGAEAHVATSIKSLFKPEFVDGANLTDEQVEKLINRWAKDYVSSFKDLFVEEEEEKTPELTKEEKIDLLKKGLIELENDDCDDKELVAAAMVARPEVLARATDEIRKDKEFISERIKENSGNAATIIENCHQEIKTDDSFAKKIVNAQPTALSSFEAETQISVVTKLVDTKPELIAGLSDEAIDILVDLDNGGDIKFKTLYDANPEIIEHLPREVYIDKNESMGKFIDNLHDYPTYTPAIFDRAIERFEKVITTGNIVDAIRENKRIEEMIVNNYETARPEDIKRVAQANIQLLNTQDTKENIERVRALIDGYKVQINDLLAEGKFTEAWNVYKQAKYVRENELGSQGLKEIPDKEIRALKTQVEEARAQAFQESPEAQQFFKDYEISITEAIRTGNIQLSDSLLTTYKQEVYLLSEDKQGEYLGKVEKFEKDFNKLVEESKNVSNDASTKTERNIASVYDFSDMDRIIFEIREELKAGNIDKAIELYNGASEYLSKLESGVNGSGFLEGDMVYYLYNNTMEEVVDLRRRLEGVADKIQDARCE